MPLASYSDAMREYAWNAADSEPATCACRGNGWTLTPWDTWEKCPFHFKGQTYPEALEHEEQP
jgi:hypothetical protein